jgi:hypothetical protein
MLTGITTSITAWVDQPADQIGFTDDEQLFGGFKSDSELGYPAQQALGDSGSRAYVTRAPRPGRAYGQVSFANLTVSSLIKAAWANDRILVDID